MNPLGRSGYGQVPGPPHGLPSHRPTPPYPPAHLQPTRGDPAMVSHRRRGSAAFTVVVTLAMLLGAGVMSLVLLASGAPTALVVGVVLAALPVGPLIACFLWLDRYEPEPLSLLAFSLGWGAFVATAAALLLQIVGQVAFGLDQAGAAVILAPVTEEAAKGLFVLLLVVWRRHELHGVLDGIVYAGMVGIGFAFTENILYLSGAYTGGGGLGPGGIEAATGTFVVRGIFSPFAHPFFTAAIGIGIGYAVTRRGAGRLLAPLLGYGVAVLAHALWNGSALLGDGSWFVLTYLFAMVPAFLLVVGFAVWARGREARMLTRALTDAAHRGLLPPYDVPWLVRLPARRAARGYARSRGGPPAEKAMREYQQQAIELGFLHDRYLRGHAPRDVLPRGQVMVNRLAALRPHVMFPPPPGIR